MRDSKTEFEMLGCEKNLSKYGRYGAGVLLQQDSYLQALVRAVQQADTDLQYPAIIILARLITHDPSTHYIVAQVTHPLYKHTQCLEHSQLWCLLQLDSSCKMHHCEMQHCIYVGTCAFNKHEHGCVFAFMLVSWIK